LKALKEIVSTAVESVNEIVGICTAWLKCRIAESGSDGNGCEE
jgi:hypothetical protein